MMWLLTVVLTACICKTGTTADYFCSSSPVSISGENTGFIHTRDAGQPFYGNNMNCVWTVNAGVGNRIQLTVLQLSLEWAPEYTTCSGYDNLRIVDGTTSSDETIASICHGRNPHVVISRGQHMYLRFSTTFQNFKDLVGVSLRFDVFASNICPPGWFQIQQNGDYCYIFGQKSKLDWATSQETCSSGQANLVSISNEEDYLALAEKGQNHSLSGAWIGLNDITKENEFVWLDKTSSSYRRQLTQNSDERNCVSWDIPTGTWTVQHCEKLKLNYICKCRKDGTTIVYSVPSRGIVDEQTGISSAAKIGLIVGGLIVVSVLLIALFCVVRHRKRKAKYRQPAQNRESSGSRGASGEVEAQESRSRTRGSAHNDSFGKTRQIQRGRSEPSAPPEENPSSSQMVAPPTYEESLQHPLATV